jgi:hypothetical protein
VECPRNFEGRIPGRIVDRDSASGAVDVLCGKGVLRILRVRTVDDTEESAARLMRNVRESLGLNHSLEIASLRSRLDRLESRLAQMQVDNVVEQPG